MKSILYSALILMVFQSCTSKLSIKDNIFYMDGKPFDMYGIRTSSATQSDELTEHLIAQLDDYLSMGINTVDVYIQGSSGGYSDPFRNNGKELDKGHERRLLSIIEACSQRSMVVVVGIFYQRVFLEESQDIRNINSKEAVAHAVSTITSLLKPYDNVIINIANEQNSGLYASFKPFDFNEPENIIDLCSLAKTIDEKRIVGGGGYHDESNVIIGKSEFVDVLLFDTFSKDIENNHTSGWHYDYFVKNGVVNKPIVNVEIFGGWTKIAMPPGVYGDSIKAIHLQELADAKSISGLYVHFHSNPWCQPDPDGEYKVRYDLGGAGTVDDPGIRWFFRPIKE